LAKNPKESLSRPTAKTLWIGHRVTGLISIIDTATNKVTGTLTAGQMPLRMGFAPNGKRVYAVSPQEGAVIVFDAVTRREIGRITIDGAPVGLIISPDSKRVFITDLKNGKVFALDAQKLNAISSIAVETLSDGIGIGAVKKKIKIQRQRRKNNEKIYFNHRNYGDSRAQYERSAMAKADFSGYLETRCSEILGLAAF
jgi:YVTN family beta-propeller protein